MDWIRYTLTYPECQCNLLSMHCNCQAASTRRSECICSCRCSMMSCRILGYRMDRRYSCRWCWYIPKLFRNSDKPPIQSVLCIEMNWVWVVTYSSSIGELLCRAVSSSHCALVDVRAAPTHFFIASLARAVEWTWKLCVHRAIEPSFLMDWIRYTLTYPECQCNLLSMHCNCQAASTRRSECICSCRCSMMSCRILGYRMDRRYSCRWCWYIPKLFRNSDKPPIQSVLCIEMNWVWVVTYSSSIGELLCRAVSSSHCALVDVRADNSVAFVAIITLTWIRSNGIYTLAVSPRTYICENLMLTCTVEMIIYCFES